MGIAARDARPPTLSGAIDKEKIGANLEDGVLTLTLPKARQAQPRKIAIG
jgi:HSP20 family protein